LPTTPCTIPSTPSGTSWPTASQSTDGFRESGGSAALHAGKDRSDVTSSTLGLRTRTGLDLGAGSAAIQASLGWRHAEGDIRPKATLAFFGGGSREHAASLQARWRF